MSNLIIPAKVGGLYRLRATNAKTSKQRLLADWFPNLITDWGLNAAGSMGGIRNSCHVGSGTTAPANTDTLLASWVAGTNSTINFQHGTQASAPYYMWSIDTFRFPEGEAAGNLSEVGVGEGDTSSSNLFSRALILDGNGDPTTITVLSNEILDVDYQFRVIAPTTDVVADITDSGTSTVHTTTLRAAAVTSGTWWRGDRMANDFAAVASWTASPARVYDGTIQTITELPTGNSQNRGGSNDAYVNDSLQNTGSLFLGLSAGNLAGGSIGAMIFQTNALGTYQVGFDPAITKNDAIELTLDFGVSWSRATI